MFDHSWSWCDSFGCFCSGGSAHIKSNNSKGSRRYSLREPFSLFPAYQFLVAPYNDLPADLVALLADSFQFQNHFNQEFFFAQLHESRFLGFRINFRSFFQPIEHNASLSAFDHCRGYDYILCCSGCTDSSGCPCLPDMRCCLDCADLRNGSVVLCCGCCPILCVLCS